VTAVEDLMRRHDPSISPGEWCASVLSRMCVCVRVSVSGCTCECVGIYACVCVFVYLYVGVGKILCSVLQCDAIHCLQDFCIIVVHDDFWTILYTVSCIYIYIYIYIV